ncbi:MAG: tyrosine-type recombinase/integrase [Bacteroidota bacterium]
MATIKYIIKNVSETSSIYLRFKDGASFDLTTKTNYKTNSNNWSKTKGQPINLKDTDLKKLDNDLKKLSLDLLNHYNNTINKNEINSQWLKDFINPKAINEVPNKLVDYFTYYELHKRNVLTTASIVKLNANKKLIERFQTNTKRVYLIKDVNEDFKLSFYDFCISENYSQNTIARALKFIKTICYHAESNNIEVSKKLSGLQINTVKVEKIYLDLNELSLIENCKDITKEHLINARDWLLISCETGQRVSDFLRFTKDMIRLENNKPLIEFTQVKTGKIMTVPLSKKVMSILEKRGGNFPTKMSDQRYNEHIKDVCETAKINKVIKGGLQIDNRKVIGMYAKWQLVTSHIGRRSFATNNYGKIPTALLIGVTGHSTEQMFLEYIGKTDTQKAMQLADYF